MDIVMANLEAIIRETEAKAYQQNGTLKTDAFVNEANRSSYEDYLEWVERKER